MGLGAEAVMGSAVEAEMGSVGSGGGFCLGRRRPWRTSHSPKSGTRMGYQPTLLFSSTSSVDSRNTRSRRSFSLIGDGGPQWAAMTRSSRWCL